MLSTKNDMKVYLDDERETPEGWVRVYWPHEAIELLKTGKVEEISLDHDLGDDEKGTGYDVVTWVEDCLLYTSPSPRDRQKSRMPSSA